MHAWIAEVERKLGKRTRVFLALTVIAIGIGGAAIYLAIDARQSSVSESDVQTLQEQLEARIDKASAGAAATAPAPVETTPPTESTPTPPAAEGSKPKSGRGGAQGQGATGGATGGAKIQELLEQAQQQSAK